MSASERDWSWLRICSPSSAHTREQHALALVVAGAVLVGLAEVAGHDRAVDGGDDLRPG